MGRGCRKAHRGLVCRPRAAIGLLALAYAITAKLGQQFATTRGGVTAVWPASGVALAAILFHGRGLWPYAPALDARRATDHLAKRPLLRAVS